MSQRFFVIKQDVRSCLYSLVSGRNWYFLVFQATDVDMLITVPISKAAANQRTGRAGRVMPGKCYRFVVRYGTVSLTAEHDHRGGCSVLKKIVVCGCCFGSSQSCGQEAVMGGLISRKSIQIWNWQWRFLYLFWTVGVFSWPYFLGRLYTEDYYVEKMQAESVPEIQRSNMVSTILQVTTFPAFRMVINVLELLSGKLFIVADAFHHHERPIWKLVHSVFASTILVDRNKCRTRKRQRTFKLQQILQNEELFISCLTSGWSCSKNCNSYCSQRISSSFLPLNLLWAHLFVQVFSSSLNVVVPVWCFG